jgi:UPF0271 protein
MRLDLNCDVGEAANPDRLVLEERIIELVSSISIACGFHAGNCDLMRRMIQLARAHGVSVGAHPGFRDPEGFGRRELMVTPEEVENLISYQVGALMGVAALEGVRVTHLKPHGALYNMAARDGRVADAIARASARVDPQLILFGLAGSKLIAAGRAAGLTVAEEAFVDRAYDRAGFLISRQHADAVLSDEREVLSQVRRLVREKVVVSVDGILVPIRAETICLHGDTPGAVRLAQLIRYELTQAGVQIAAVGHAIP